jgi:hypothetical protein
MPLLSFQGGDRARLGGFRSVAYPPSEIRGRWN